MIIVVFRISYTVYSKQVKSTKKTEKGSSFVRKSQSELERIKM